MSFLEPLMLAALPLVALPILIHLIHRHRHQTVPWAAMMFLVSAKRMNKGMARLRHILILLMRMVAVGALIFAVSRPLASGWLGGIGMGRPDATLILLDRSASMEAQDLQTGESKRSTSLGKLVDLLGKRDYGTQLVLIDSASGEARAIDSPEALLGLPLTEATATSADIPGMLETALAYLEANKSGRADIWICSDLSENDWDPASGRWTVLREQFAQFEGVNHFLLAYADRPSNNLSVRVANVKRRQNGDRAELILDIMVRAESPPILPTTQAGLPTIQPGLPMSQPAQASGAPRQVLIEIEVNGVSSVVEVELDAGGASLQGHRIPIDSRLGSGWGVARLPGDSNPLDNRFYFSFSEPAVRKAIIVSDDPRTGEAFRRALAIPMDPGLKHSATVIPSARVGEIDWESTGLLIWQAPLPTGLVAVQLEGFVDSARVIMFFPPVQKDDEQLFASRWGDWQKAGQEQSKLTWWRGDADLLAHTASGDALPLNELRIYRYCALESRGTPLARLGDESPLLTRVPTDRGGVYFCSTLPTAQFSSLAREGVVFYAMLQRALAEGSRSLDSASGRAAGRGVLADRARWEVVAPAEDAPTVSERGLHAGVYRDGDYWVAVNRGPAEDHAKVVSVETVDALFGGLSYRRIDDAVGDTDALASEIWRTFLIAMALALIVEAALSLPGKKIEPQHFGDFAAARGSVNQVGSP